MLQQVMEKKFQGYGHIRRMEDERMAKEILNG